MNTAIRDKKIYTRFIELSGNITMAKLGEEFNIGGHAASMAIDNHKRRRKSNK